jgi:tRNA-dihydrouridine synthase
MGCPVRKVLKTGAGAQLIADPDLAVAVASAAVDGAGGKPVTVKLRSGLKPGDHSGAGVAERLVAEAGVAAIAFHPRSAAVGHKGKPDYALARELQSRIDVPVIISGGLASAEKARAAYELSGADAVMIARGSLGYPWIFEELTGARTEPPGRDEIVAELLWVMDRAEEHFGERAGRYLRKFYPWYLERLEVGRADADAFQRCDDIDEVREMVRRLADPAPSPSARESVPALR